MRHVIMGGLLGLALGLSGCSSDPSTPEHWDKRIASAKGAKEKRKAIEDLRGSKFMTPAMLPMLQKRLDAEKKPEVKGDLARLLGESKDASNIETLVNAIDMAASDSESKTMNKEIAVALGKLNDPRSAQALVKLLKVKDNYTVIAAIEGLGAMKAKEAFDALNAIASDDAIEPFITKKAIVALGEVADPRAVPTLVKAMFKERRGVSFYMESSFALYVLGQPAADALLPVVDSQDKALIEWASKSNVKEMALVAKSAQVLGDLHEARAEKSIVGLLNYKSDFDDIRLIIRMRAADALGRMRSKEAIKPLAALLDEEEPSARREYVWSLSRIGGKDAVARLVETSGKGGWDAREQSMRGVAMLGDDPAAFDAFAANEEKLFTAQCKDDPEFVDCKDVAASVKKHQEKIAAFKLRAAAAAECKGEAACWAKKLDEKDEGVRERAAYELGRSKDVAAVDALMGRLAEKNLDTRLAIIQGADWLVHDSKEAMTKAQTFLPALEKQLADERGKTEFIKTNEDLRRLQVKVKRG